MTEYGVVHGRFQILHNDHLKYILEAKKRCRQLVVGITNPDPMHTRSEPADPDRSSPEANPLNYFERSLVIKEVLLETGLRCKDFFIMPFPINFPEYCKYYIPSGATLFLTIYDRWGEEKYRRLQALGFKTEILWRRPVGEKGISSSAIRELITTGMPYENLVPPAAFRLLKSMDIENRLKGASGI